MSSHTKRFTFEYKGTELPVSLNLDETKNDVINRIKLRWKVAKHVELVINDLLCDGVSLSDDISAWPSKKITISTQHSEMPTMASLSRISSPPQIHLNDDSDEDSDSEVFKVEESSNTASLSRVTSMEANINLLIAEDHELCPENETESGSRTPIDMPIIEKAPEVNKKAVSSKGNAFMKLVKKQTPKNTGPELPVLKREEIKRELTKTQVESGYSLKQFKAISEMFEKQGATLQ